MPQTVEWSSLFENWIASGETADVAHDLAHIRRVVQMAGRLAEAEEATLEIVMPAAWLHDCVTTPKSSSDRQKASRWAADRAIGFLAEVGYPLEFHGAIHHAIEAHSFSSGIEPRTIEAKVVQDADRLDALGALGIARCFALGGAMGSAIYSESDPFCAVREPDDRRFTLDHFPAKLLKLAGGMQTASGRAEAAWRMSFMESYLARLREEIAVR
ncbi:MAG TPA: HD domain-containing protein [Chthoniobacterales bacterium]